MNGKGWVAIAAVVGAVAAAAISTSTSTSNPGEGRGLPSPSTSTSTPTPTPTSTSTSTSTSAARALDWPSGTRHLYGFAWNSEHAVRVADGQAMAIAVDLAGEIAIDSYGKRGDVFVLAASFTSLSKARLVVNGKPAYADDARELAGKRALVEVDARGAVRNVSIDGDPSGLFRHLMRGVLVEISATLPTGTEDTVSEIGPSGTARTHYARDPRDPSRVVRRREEYETLAALGARQLLSDELAPQQRLASRATIAIGADGAIASIASNEELVVGAPGKPDVRARSTFEMTLAQSVPFDASSPPSLVEPRSLGAPGASTELSKRLLDQRVDGLTAQRMKSDLLVYATTGSIVEQERWVWRATGLLEQKPEACADLLASFESAGLDGEARALVLDLLASVGHARAQSTMREALASKAATGDPAMMQLYVQRFSFVAAPENESVDFLLAARAKALSRNEPRIADAIDYTLGSMAAHLAASGRPERAVMLRDRFVAQLDAAKAPRDRKIALAALGNAGFVSDTARIIAAARDDDEQVRSQAAWSLRKLESPEARSALVDLVGDARTAVQTSAAKTLASMTLAEADLAHLEAVVRGGAVKATTYVALVALLPAGDAHGRGIVEYLLAKGDADADAIAKMQAWLGPVSVSSPR